MMSAWPVGMVRGEIPRQPVERRHETPPGHTHPNTRRDMAKRKTAEERIKAHRAQADRLEAAAKLRALKNSPAWRATFKAMEKIDEAMALLHAESLDARDREHLNALDFAFTQIADVKRARFDPAPEDAGGAR
jgi:hypothetical protein